MKIQKIQAKQPAIASHVDEDVLLLCGCEPPQAWTSCKPGCDPEGAGQSVSGGGRPGRQLSLEFTVLILDIEYRYVYTLHFIHVNCEL